MAARPRVVWDALVLRSRPTGVGLAVVELAQAFARRDRGLDLTILVTDPRVLPSLADAPGVRLLACPGAAGGTLRKAVWTQAALPRLLRRLGADLLHALHFISPLRAPCPTVLTVHDLAFLRYPRTVEQPRRSYYRLFVPRSLARAGRILASSRATQEEIGRFLPAVAGRVRPAPLGTPSWALQRPTPPPARSAAAPFLFVGTREPRKNLPRLLAAYELLLARQRGAQPPPGLVLVGPQGWGGSELAGPLARLREAGKVRLVGYCSQPDLWDLYGSARALLFPSLQEGFGFPILEAMAAGLPVVTSDRSSMREVAGGAALLVDPTSVDSIADAMQRLLREPDLGPRLAAAGLANARRWTWERTVEATLAAYDELLPGGRRRSIPPLPPGQP